MNDKFESQVLADLAILKTQMATLVGDGQPGRVRVVEQQLERHEAVIQRARMLVIAIVPVLVVFHLALHFTRLH